MTATEAIVPLPSDAAVGLARRAIRSVVQVEDGRRGAGSGVIVDSRGLIITNAHVVRGRTAKVTLHDGTRHEGRVEARDDAIDLAAIRIEREGLEAAEYGDSRSLRPGQLVMAVGHPLQLHDAVTLGVVSRPSSPSDQRELIASNISLNRGNSGGPLLDAMGQIVGINAMVAGPGLGLAIPSHAVRRFLAQHVDPRPHIGVSVQAVEKSLMVTDVLRESAAEAAGIYPGDIIVAIDDRAADQLLALLDGIVAAGVGGTVHLDLMRAGRAHSVQTTVAAQA